MGCHSDEARCHDGIGRVDLGPDQQPEDDVFQQMLFSKIVPNCKKLGLLDAGDGWLRQKFTEINVIQFEDWKDTGEEYEELDMVAADRAAEVAAS